MSTPILLVGGDSEIGSATAKFLRLLNYEVLATTRRHDRVTAERPFLDLSMPLDNWSPPENARAVCILAAAARLQDCAADPVGTSALNVTQSIALIDRIVARDVPILFLSTDKVFDGTRPHVPAETPTNPVSEYGRQKAATEAAIHDRMTDGARIAILRLAKVVSPGMALLRQWMVALEVGEPIRTFRDMMMAPTPIAIVVDAIRRLISDPVSGTFQLTGPRDASYTDIGCYLARKLGADEALVGAVSAKSVGGMPLGSTPPHTTLNSTALRERFGITVPDVWDVIDELVRTCRD